jgi:hypothetical protein
VRRSDPQRLKAAYSVGASGTAKQLAEKLMIRTRVCLQAYCKPLKTGPAFSRWGSTFLPKTAFFRKL